MPFLASPKYKGPCYRVLTLKSSELVTTAILVVIAISTNLAILVDEP